MKAIVNGKIILKDRIVEDAVLLYSDVIEGIVSKDSVPADAEIIDAKCGYISPRFIDLHIHGYLGKDVCDGEKVSGEDFDKKVKNMYLDVAKEIGENIPIEVANDGDVTALAGAMDLNDNAVLGVAMGTSEAGGYVDPQGNITGWLNELAFVPVDYCKDAMVDEWSGDYGCGVKYFSQDGVIKLAPFAGIELHIPDESSKRVGQSVAAASLPKI